MNERLWKKLNSPIVISFVGTVVIGVSVFFFESYTENRDRSLELIDRLDRLGFEYAGRLSQYSEWFMYLLEDSDGPITPKLKSCVNPDLIKASIRTFANSPTPEASWEYNSSPCNVDFSYGAIFPEYANHSTVGVLAEMLLIAKEMRQRGEGRTARPEASGCDYDVIPLSERLTSAINDFLNPDAVIPLHMDNMDDVTVPELRGRFMCSFYGIGPNDLWYSDVFIG